MYFIKIDKLKKGMKLARPVYNKNGVLLYDINTKLTKQNVNSIKNFEIIGVYILEPTEPNVVLSEDDREFERFQTVSVFALKEQLELIIDHQGGRKIEQLSANILSKYGKAKNKINFLKNLRSTEDYAYKHSISVAILSAIISAQLDMSYMEQLNIVTAALLHEIGRTMVPQEVLKKGSKLTKEEIYIVNKCEIDGNELIQHDFDIPSLTRIMLAQNLKEINGKGKKDIKLLDGTKVLRVADVFDTMTSMGLAGEPYSDVMAVRYLLSKTEDFEERVVGALLKGINILNPGVCVQLSTGERGLVIRENDDNILRPMVLGFRNNRIYDLRDNISFGNIQIYDVLKTMDNRVPIDREAVIEYFQDEKEPNLKLRNVDLEEKRLLNAGKDEDINE